MIYLFGAGDCNVCVLSANRENEVPFAKLKKVKEDGGCIDVLKMYCGHQWWNQSLDSRVWGHNTFPRIFIHSTYGVFPYICHLNHHVS